MIKPLNDRCLVKPEVEEKIKGTNLVLPEAAKEKETGVGICVDGEYKGKTIYFKKYAAEEITHEDIEYYIVDNDDIIAYLEE